MIADIKTRAIHRTKILEGQIRGLQRTQVAEMFEAGGDETDRAVSELLTVFELSRNRTA